MAVDWGEAAAEGWKVIASVAGVVGALLGVQKWLASRRVARAQVQAALDARFAKLADKDQVERHKQANEEQVQQARDDINNLYRLNEKQNDKLDVLQRDMNAGFRELLQAIKKE